MEFDLVTVGGVTVDLFLLIDSTNPHFRFNSATNELSMHLGDKIVLDNAKFTVGGNAENIAIGLKRLGFRTAIIAEIGNDEFSDNIIYSLKKEGVDSSLIKRGTGESSFSVILNYKDDRTIFTRKIEKDHDFSFDKIMTKWIYLTSLGNKWKEAYQKVSYFIDEKKVKLAFNPGGAQIDRGMGAISYLLKQTEILIVNKEEGELMINDKQSLRSDDLKGLMINDLLFELKKLGPKIVVVTDGENGSHAMDETAKVYSQDALKVRVVSKTGAGDAYSSGFLGAILLGYDIQKAMVWGTKNAASELRRVGAHEGVLTLEQMQL